MWKNLRLRPILASVLVLAFARETFAVGTSTASAETSVYNYAGHVTFTVEGIAERTDPGEGQTTTVLEDFPLLLRIKEEMTRGFGYSLLRNGTNDLVFLDTKGQSLNYEIETWNPAGESLVWVKAPSLRNGAEIMMCWGLRDGCKKPVGNEPTAVWSDYVGVWHMDEAVDEAGATAQTHAADASAHGHDLVPRVGPEGVYYTQTSAEGVFGNARVNDTSKRYKKQGSYFEAFGTEDVAFDGVFTLSFWIKFDAYANYPQLATRRSKTSNYTGFQIDLASENEKTLPNPRRCLIARGDTQTGSYQPVVDADFKDLGYTHLAFVYDATNVSIYANGVCKVDKMTIGKASDNGLPIAIGNQNGGTDQSVWGKYDEIRLCKGVKSMEWIAAEAEQTNANFCAVGGLTNDTAAVLKNDWVREPSITKVVWEDGTYPTRDDFDIVPQHGTNVTVVVYDRATGAVVASNEFEEVEFPRWPGSYRVVFTVAQSGTEDDGIWGALEQTLGYRIAKNAGSHEFNVNVARIMLANDDYTVDGGEVEWQSYDYDADGRYSDIPYWRHLDSDGNDASTTYCDYWSDSEDFNLGGGTHHIYRYGEGVDRLWDLRDIRIGNTFNNGEIFYERTGRDEEYREGLASDQNYLPWNPESQRVLGRSGLPVDGRHRYVGHIVMQNTTNAAVTSTCYTNGIGTIYFDAVNGWTGNVTNANGAANYRLVVEIATGSKIDPALPPTERYISSSAEEGLSVDEADAAYDPFYWADWVACTNLHVLYFDRDDCTDLGTRRSVELKATAGGNYECFYRVIVPVNLMPKTGGIRFRIRREAIDPEQSLYPDGTAYILLDNIVCSEPAACVQLMPYGKYFPEKTRQNNEIVEGWEGAFVPAYPSVAGDQVFGRAKATLPDGSAIPSGVISSATMHYRWHYLEQRTTGWLEADLVPETLVTQQPLELPPFQGDIDFWFDAVQHGHYYVYADYSGTGVGLGNTGYSEEIPAVTNHAPTVVVGPDGTRTGDWFVRTREGKSDYSELKLLVKTSEDGEVCEEPLAVVQDNLWRGYYRMTNVFDNGIWWRIEARNKQEDGAQEWNWSTNRWYVMDWVGTLPTFPAAGRMSEGTTNSWCRMPCDKQTGYLMFQVDETSLGVTAIRSDYQCFDKWNDAGKGYFTGSSTEAEGKSGTSSDVREYSLSYASWADTLATNVNWVLDLNGHTIGETNFPGYKTFASFNNYFKAWQIGKGMWVYGKYCEPSSHVALQMAGNGEGYAEFSNQTQLGSNWPRGLESVSFHARIAQDVSPDYAAFYDGEAPQRMTNYTFMARTCFDQQDNRGFCGNASLSLFSYYREKVGAYEARWEQIAGEMTKGDYEGVAMGPKKDGQRLVISRWNWVTNGYVRTELVATTNYLFTGTDKWGFDMPTMPSAVATNNLMPLLISTYHSPTATYVVAAVYVRAKTGANTGVGTAVTVPNANWYCVTLKDTSSKRLKYGNYGVLSANCEGMFVTPQFNRNPVWPKQVHGVTTSDRYQVTTWNQCSPQSLNNYTYTQFHSCVDDIVFDDDGYNLWTVVRDYPGRVAVFYDEDDPERGNYGFTFVRPNQTVDVLAKPLGSTEGWDVSKHCIGQVPITDFGHPGPDPDHQPMFYYTSDSYVRLQTGGGLDDYPTDVVIQDIDVRQWRGDVSCEYSEKEKDRYNYHTNFVYTSGWVTNGAVQLSAKRTAVGTPCSIRSPLLDGDYGTGVGLGGFRFSYRRPQENIHLLVQIATNVTGSGLLRSLTDSVKEGTGNQSWHTVTNLYFKDLWSDDLLPPGATNTWNQPFGYHGARGLMRVIVDPDLVEQVSDPAWKDTSVFGAIDITAVKCFDEPALDKGCWWGWNIQTVGDATDSQKRMYLPDGTWDIHFGQSLALNNSTTADVNPEEEAEKFREHMPFLQSPTFTNAYIGQVSFKARKYELSDYAPDAQVVVYGANRSPDNLKDSEWLFVAAFPVTNTIYTTYSCKIDATDICALRLAVVDVPGTPPRPRDPKWTTDPQRVLLDEVSVSEAVRAMLAFRNVGAFRSDLNKNNYVEGVTTSKEQPLCDENWGVQAEVFATMLGDEIDKSYTPRVKLHWYVSKYDELTKETWGWENWKSIKEKTKGKNGKIVRDSAWLAQTDGSNYVYRSSYDAAPAAVMDAQSDPGTVVQYMLEVEYQTINTTQGKTTYPKATNWLDLASWKVPEWYAPVDYNNDPQYGAGKTFAAFTILDTVAPGWAWINEANVYGTDEGLLRNSDAEFQYVEACVPMEADLTGWKIRFLEAYIAQGEVVTNDVAKFGSTGLDQAPGTKKSPVSYNKTFRCLGNKESDKLKKGNGTLDGVWAFSAESYLFRQLDDGTYYLHYVDTPFGVQLVRPTGIIESSVVVVGTNALGGLSREYNPTNVVAALNRMVPGSRFFYAAEDCCGTFRSGSVMRSKGESPSVWTNNWACSPGYLNTNWGGKVEQIIDPDHPTPHGDSIVIYATVDLSGGPIRQWVGGAGSEQTNETEMVILKRGSARGTNIVYQVEPWYELGSVTTNDAAFWPYRPRVRYTNIVVGVGASNNLRVVAKAQVDSDLSNKYGLTPDNPFTPAVMSWLLAGTDAYGNRFAHNGEIAEPLAEYWDMADTVVTNLTLTQMYCLDMDPTVSNLIFKAGMTGDVWPVPPPQGSDTGLTNDRMRVFMMISNKVEAVPGPEHKLRRAWSPYILRGFDPNFTSWDYNGGGVIAQSWTSETFKITGLLDNDKQSLSVSYQEGDTPLRWFVFHEDSFRQEEGALRFTTDIEIIDPHSISSPGGAAAGWYDWCEKYGWAKVYYSWAIDMRLKPVGVEILQPTNFYPTAVSK